MVRAAPNSPAAGAGAGLRAGDVTKREGQTLVTTPQAVQQAVQSIMGKQSGAEKSVGLHVNRGVPQVRRVLPPDGCLTCFEVLQPAMESPLLW